MKRLACVLLVCLVAVAACGVAEDETVHLLWGIPFGTPERECIALLAEKGIEVERGNGGVATLWKTTEKQSITALGYPVECLFYFNENGFSHATIEFISRFPQKPSDEMKRDLSAQLAETGVSVLAALGEQYGGLTAGYFAAGSFPQCQYDYPQADGVPDNDVIGNAIEMNEHASIYSYFGNVELCIVKSESSLVRYNLLLSYYDGVYSLNFNDRPVDFSGSFGTYECIPKAVEVGL